MIPFTEQMTPSLQKQHCNPCPGAGKEKKSPSRAGGWKSKHIQLIAAHYPGLFRPRNVKPLKVGIREDIQSDMVVKGLSVDPKYVAWALAALTRTPRYLRSVAAGGLRYDLRDQPCGQVTPEQQIMAKATLAAMNNRRETTAQALAGERSQAAKKP
ncbi:ProQ/FinO family protein [Erwinia tracheiphila]|uniref:ProQ/FinO domain-containing protein n=1 Tax=Erwinia tracheiphila TaxID=65700 RepID=A0A345CUQ1_9GAMM|nr:ProQ/FINO family protein [Erwinia tracheiphila]AXF77168.1 hypothetical protein AV903_15865 [Erwinia tracheiphila]UIA84141.1 ProQ/FinO family protein [Erwinia tracheiphila]UIA92723.1 ProQ/FinO family protein [Erwinia tracheiphila]